MYCESKFLRIKRDCYLRFNRALCIVNISDKVENLSEVKGFNRALCIVNILVVFKLTR